MFDIMLVKLDLQPVVDVYRNEVRKVEDGYKAGVSRIQDKIMILKKNLKAKLKHLFPSKKESDSDMD